MNAIVEKALRYWGMECAEYELIAARENSVFRVYSSTGSVALRLHRQGYRTDAELRSELLWMQAVTEGGIEVPAPIPTKAGQMLQLTDGVQVDMLTWLSGMTLNSAMETQDTHHRAGLFRALGKEMARFHDICDAWPRPAEFDRVTWNIDGLLGDAPHWGRFWDNPHLSSQDKRLFQEFQEVATVELTRRQNGLDFGLIHADLVPANVMVSGQTLKLIDFDDGGFGFRDFEVATALLKHTYEDDYLSLRNALIKGYTSIRDIDLTTLDLFLAIRAATYVGWNITRLGETDALERNARFIDTTRDLARKYLAR